MGHVAKRGLLSNQPIAREWSEWSGVVSAIRTFESSRGVLFFVIQRFHVVGRDSTDTPERRESGFLAHKNIVA
jgi:hypothetical protein